MAKDLRLLSHRDYGFLRDLARQGDLSSIKKLIKAVGGIDSNVCCFVIVLLGKLAAIEAVPTLRKFLLPHSRGTNDSKEEAAIALGKIASKHGLDGETIDLLIQACKEAKLATVRTAAAQALALCKSCRAFSKRRSRQTIKILNKHLTCRYLKQRKASAQALQMIGWQPQDLAEKTRLLIALQDWQALSRPRNHFVQSLMALLKEGKELESVQVKIARALGRCGSLKAALTVIEWFFQRGVLIQNEEELRDWEKDMRPLFADYTSLILRAASFVIKTKTEWEDKWGDNGEIIYHYDCSHTEAALKELCQLKTSIACNLLLCAAKKADTKIVTGEGWNAWGGGENHGVLKFDTFRQKVKAELISRNKSRMSPSAYSRRANWYINTNKEDLL